MEFTHTSEQNKNKKRAPSHFFPSATSSLYTLAMMQQAFTLRAPTPAAVTRCAPSRRRGAALPAVTAETQRRTSAAVPLPGRRPPILSRATAAAEGQETVAGNANGE